MCHFDKATGEAYHPEGETNVARLLALIESGSIGEVSATAAADACAPPVSDTEVLRAIAWFTRPSAAFWSQHCFTRWWCCPTTARSRRRRQRSRRAAHGGPHVRIELRGTPPTLFYLIANESLRLLMNALSPAGAVRPVHRMPERPPQYSGSPPSAGPARRSSQFSLAAVTTSFLDQGYPDSELPVAPRGLALTPKHYQLSALAWMQQREALPGGINSLLWEERRFCDGPRTAAEDGLGAEQKRARTEGEFRASEASARRRRGG